MYIISVRMFDEIEKQSGTAEDPNFSFFGRELLLMLLCPVVGLRLPSLPAADSTRNYSAFLSVHFHDSEDGVYAKFHKAD